MQLEPRSAFPIVSIEFTATISILLSPIAIGSTVAFNDVVSLAISGLYTSHLIGNALLFYRRVTGQILTCSSSQKTLTKTMDTDFSYGPWKIQEPFGTLLTVLGVYIWFLQKWKVECMQKRGPKFSPGDRVNTFAPCCEGWIALEGGSMLVREKPACEIYSPNVSGGPEAQASLSLPLLFVLGILRGFTMLLRRNSRKAVSISVFYFRWGEGSTVYANHIPCNKGW